MDSIWSFFKLLSAHQSLCNLKFVLEISVLEISVRCLEVEQKGEERNKRQQSAYLAKQNRTGQIAK